MSAADGVRGSRVERGAHGGGLLVRRSALDDHPLLRELPRRPDARVTIEVRPPIALLQVSAFARSVDECAARLSGLVGLALPDPNRIGGDDALNVRAIGHGVWQLAGDHGRMPDVPALRSSLQGVATVVDLGHARTVFRLSGPDASRTINKHCGLDLDRHVFADRTSTNTRFNQLGMTLTRVDRNVDAGAADGSAASSAPTYDLMVFRGYAVFVFESLVESAREFTPVSVWMPDARNR